MLTPPTGVAVIALSALAVAALGAEPGPGKPAAAFEGTDTLLRPAGYREWVFVGSSLGLRYDEGERPSEKVEFKNVYIRRLPCHVSRSPAAARGGPPGPPVSNPSPLRWNRCWRPRSTGSGHVGLSGWTSTWYSSAGRCPAMTEAGPCSHAR